MFKLHAFLIQQIACHRKILANESIFCCFNNSFIAVFSAYYRKVSFLQKLRENGNNNRI